MDRLVKDRERLGSDLDQFIKAKGEALKLKDPVSCTIYFETRPYSPMFKSFNKKRKFHLLNTVEVSPVLKLFEIQHLVPQNPDELQELDENIEGLTMQLDYLQV